MHSGRKKRGARYFDSLILRSQAFERASASEREPCRDLGLSRTPLSSCFRILGRAYKKPLYVDFKFSRCCRPSWAWIEPLAHSSRPTYHGVSDRFCYRVLSGGRSFVHSEFRKWGQWGWKSLHLYQRWAPVSDRLRTMNSITSNAHIWLQEIRSGSFWNLGLRFTCCNFAVHIWTVIKIHTWADVLNYTQMWFGAIASDFIVIELRDWSRCDYIELCLIIFPPTIFKFHIAVTK